MPEKGKPFEEFMKEDGICRQWADRQIGNSAQETYNSNVATGAVVGTAVGAGLGAAIGSTSGNAGTGAAIGAASGLLVGSAAGSNSGQVYGREAQRRYDNAYVQCMYTYGNQVPGYRKVVMVAPKPVVVTPPPPPLPPADQPADIAQNDDIPPPEAIAPPENTPPPPPPEVAPAPGQYTAPPPVYLDQAPQFLYSQQLGMYVAVGVPYDIVYTGNEYFYWYGGRWFHGPFYNGPWTFATRAYYPPALLQFRIGYIRHYRNFEYRQWKKHGKRYTGRVHRPEFRR
jgi:hypothetical protein